jgi:hypothetical protein
VIATLEAEEAAMACVAAALRRLHFSVAQRDPKSPGAAGIEAWKGTQRIVVHVTTIVSPARPQPLTHDEEQEPRRQASRADGQPWEARVLLGPDLELVQLEWRPLEEGEAGE